MVTRVRNTPETVELNIDGQVKAVPLLDLSATMLERCEPVRGFRWHRGQRHFPGWYWSATNGAHVTYESQLELARLQLADHDRNVVAIRSQPFRLEARDAQGQLRRHVPDFALLQRDGLVRIVNVKPAHRLLDPKVSEALAWAHGTLSHHGFATEVWSGESPALLANMRFIAGFRNPALFDPEELATAAAVLAGAWTVATAEVALARLGLSDTRPVLMHLIWRGDLICDLASVIEPTTTLEAA